MATTTIADSRHTDDLLEEVERQTARLRRARPHLDSRITKAEHIIITHLACPRRRIIRARVRGAHIHYLVTGSGGSVYQVDPRDWSCSCPDHHRRGGICKHAITCWILERAYNQAPSPKPKKRAYISGQSRPTDNEIYATRNPLWGLADPERLDRIAERLGV